MLKISIPKPCHEDWGNMNPNQQGRHCTACAKTVVDFTSMNDEEVKYFFLDKKENSVCGRFKNEQLQRISIILPQHIFQLTMPRWKQFLAACLLAFSGILFSCDAVVDKNKNELIGILMVEIPVTKTTSDSLPIAGMEKTCTTIISECLTTKGDIIMYESTTQAEPFIEDSVPIEQPTNSVQQTGISMEDSSQKFIVGKLLLDSNLIAPIKPVDTIKIKNPLKVDSVKCDNQNAIYL